MPCMTAFPSEEELEEFEKSYAGPQSKELDKRYAELRMKADPNCYFDYTNDDDEILFSAVHDLSCLVCLGEIDYDSSFDRISEDFDRRTVMHCHSCARVMHMGCLKRSSAFDYRIKSCVLCQKRGWHKIGPLIKLAWWETHTEDSLIMEKAKLMRDWKEIFVGYANMKKWSKLHDDGSLRSDRQLLIDLDLVEIDSKQNTIGEDASDDVGTPSTCEDVRNPTMDRS